MVQPVSGILLLRGVAGNSEGRQARDYDTLARQSNGRTRAKTKAVGNKVASPCFDFQGRATGEPVPRQIENSAGPPSKYRELRRHAKRSI